MTTKTASNTWSDSLPCHLCFMEPSRTKGSHWLTRLLIGANTLQRHDRLLQDRFGIRVQWTNEHGGSVRGVCGQEETTRICYIPIGLGGKSGVLRVQVVPGDIPMLLPAYLLTDLEAVIDMKNCMIMFLKIGVSLKMTRQSTGHVSIGVCEFGEHGFHVPSDYAFCRSQAWSLEATWVCLLSCGTCNYLIWKL